MDTVLGCEGSRKVLLTLLFTSCSFMMTYLFESKEAQHMEAVFDTIEQTIRFLSFSNVFLLILTDRGGEFQNPDALECGKDNHIRIMMSHINSSPRQSLGDLSPMALAKLMLPKELLDCFGLVEIPADEIVLIPVLFRK